MAVPSLYIGMSAASVSRFPVSTLEVASRISKEDGNFMEDEGYASLWGNCQIGDYGYFCAESYDDPIDGYGNVVAVYKVHLPTFAYVGTLELECGDSDDYAYLYGICADPSGDYLYTYALRYTQPVSSQRGLYLHKIRVSDFTLVDSLDLSASYGVVGWGLTDANNLIADDTHLYAYCRDKTSGLTDSIVKVQTSDMTFVAVMGLQAELDARVVRIACLTVLNGYLYGGCTTAANGDPPRLFKVDLSDFSFVSALAVDDGVSTYQNNDLITSIATDGTHLYVSNEANASNPVIIAKVDPSDMSIVSCVELTDETHQMQRGLIVDAKWYLTAANQAGTGAPYKQRIFEIDTSDLTVLNTGDSTPLYSSDTAFPNIMYALYQDSVRRLRQIHVIT